MSLVFAFISDMMDFPFLDSSLGINKAAKGFCIKIPFATHNHGVTDNENLAALLV